jgi:sirohydrochlorin ferrochelatase
MPEPIPTSFDPNATGIVIVDHGSRRAESNDMLLAVAAMFAEHGGWPIVEPAHMELAEPTIAAAYASCVERGARTIVVQPFFLGPGKHWNADIPELTAAAAADHPGTRFLVTAPLGVHPAITAILNDRIAHCLAHVAGQADACDICRGTDRCRLRAADPPVDAAG